MIGLKDSQDAGPPCAMHEPGLRVSLVLHRFSRGGTDRVAAHLARGFADRGMTVDLIVFTRSGEIDGVLTDLIGPGIAITYLGAGNGPRSLDLIRGLPGLVRRLRRERPGVVISTANNTAMIAAIACRMARLKGRLYIKTTNPIVSSRHTGLPRLTRRLSYRVIFGWTDGVWTLSGHESEEMVAAFPRFSGLFRDVINPYVTQAMLAPPIEPSAGSCERTIISIGRLTGQKRLDRLIAAFAEVRTPGARLQILGEGEDRAALTAQIERLGVSDRVTMPGYVPHVAAALRAADLLVLTSDYEGLPAVLLEAMGANLPVIATACFPGARAILERAEGCAIIEDTAPASLARQIEAHLAMPRPTSLHAIAEQYSIENGVQSHIAALTSFIQGPPLTVRATPPGTGRTGGP